MTMASTKDKYAILGSGCIGCACGISLGLNGYDVCFVGRDSERFRRIIERKWLSLKEPEAGSLPKRYDTDQITSDYEAGLKDRNVVLVATKRTANKNIAEILSKFAARNAVVVMLQNGLYASQDVVAMLRESNRDDLIVIDSVVNFNVVEEKPGEFNWVTKRADSIIAIDGTEHAKLIEEKLCSALRAVGLDSYPDRDFLSVAAGKLLLNLFNAPNALVGCDIEGLMVIPEYRAVWRASIQEARAVFRAMHVSQRGPRNRNRFMMNYLEMILSAPTPIVAAIAKMKGLRGVKSSMLQDLENKVEETEIDFITGFIVKKGAELGVSTPVSSRLVELVKAAASKKLGSPNMSPDELTESVGLSLKGTSTCIIS